MQNTKKLEIFNMSQERVLEIASTAPGKKLLPALAAAYLAEETTRDAKAAASKPAPATATATPHIDALVKAKAQAKARPAPPANPLADVAEHLLRQRASHRSSPPSDAAAAIAELARRGTTYSNGCFSRSHRNV